MEIQKDSCNLNLHLYSTVSNALPVTSTCIGEGGKPGQETQFRQPFVILCLAVLE